MALAAQVIDTYPTRRRRIIRYKVTPTGNYPTGGDVLDFTAATNPLGLTMAYPSAAFVPPADSVNFKDSLAGALPEWVVGSTLANAKVKLWSSAGSEHANGVYTAAELADTFFMEVTIPIGK